MIRYSASNFEEGYDEHGHLVKRFVRTEVADNVAVNVRGISVDGKAQILITISKKDAQTTNYAFIIPEKEAMSLFALPAHDFVKYASTTAANKKEIKKIKKTTKKMIKKAKKSAKKKYKKSK